MTGPHADWISTGQAAELCAVTPATVLNWIRRGKLAGVRTPGGHFRIRREDLEPIIAWRAVPLRPDGRGGRNPKLRCWEYLSDGESLRDECAECVVYRVRASWCFRIAALGLDMGHAKRFCPTSCDDCAYYRRVNGIPTNVLVVSSDTGLLNSLEREAPKDMVLRFARNAYDASAVVERFLPAFAVVDLEIPGAREGSLLESLGKDPRLPGLKTVIAVGPGRQGSTNRVERSPFVVGRIEKPFDLSQIRSVIESFPVESL